MVMLPGWGRPWSWKSTAERIFRSRRRDWRFRARCSLPTSTTAPVLADWSWLRSAAAASRLAPKEGSCRPWAASTALGGRGGLEVVKESRKHRP